MCGRQLLCWFSVGLDDIWHWRSLSLETNLEMSEQWEGEGGRRERGGGRGEGGSNIRSTSTCIYNTAHAELKRECRVRALLLVSFNVWNLSTRRSDPSHLSAPAFVFKLMHMYLGVEFGSEVRLGAN